MVKKNWSVYVGMLAGIALVVVGVVFLTDFKMYYGNIKAVTFGGDFYTQIHEVTTHAANTLREIYEMVRIACGTIMVTLGIADVAAFAGKLTVCIKEKNVEHQVEEE